MDNDWNLSDRDHSEKGPLKKTPQAVKPPGRRRYRCYVKRIK